MIGGGDQMHCIHLSGADEDKQKDEETDRGFPSLQRLRTRREIEEHVIVYVCTMILRITQDG